jgi:hypothetical protein
MAWLGSAGSHASKTWALGALLSGSLGACGDDQAVTYEHPVAQIDDRTLDASVVEMIAKRDDITKDEAKALALDQLRLAAAYEEEVAAQAAESVLIDPARQRHLLRSARARLWLTEDFEPRHGLDAVPKALIDQNIEKRDVFHPRIHWICMAIVMPAETDDEGRHFTPPDDEQWWTRARALATTVEERLHRYIPKPQDEPNCDFFGQVARLGNPKTDEDLFLKIEASGLHVCARDRWDPLFVEAFCDKVDEPRWVEPFRTQFGVHVAAVIRIDESTQAEGDERRKYLREQLHPPWQAQAFSQYLERLRAKQTVRLAKGLDGEDAAAPASEP